MKAPRRSGYDGAFFFSMLGMVYPNEPSAEYGLWLSYRQCLVFRCFHNLPLSGTFIIDAAQVKNSVDNHAMQFVFVWGAKLFRIGAYRIQTDE